MLIIRNMGIRINNPESSFDFNEKAIMKNGHFHNLISFAWEQEHSGFWERGFPERSSGKLLMPFCLE